MDGQDYGIILALLCMIGAFVYFITSRKSGYVIEEKY